MQHAEHFLSRLARLEREHAEIALGLYYDSALVKHVLRVAEIQADHERVALCLGTLEQGPFIIVTRDGHFVTCLGEGMRLQDGQPVISRHRLDTISESVSALRSLVADARAGNRSQTRRKLDRVFHAGAGLSLQEFEDSARWLPLLAVEFVKTHMLNFERCNAMVEQLSRIKKFKRRDDELLHEYWRTTWSIAHLTMLLGSDGGTILRGMFEKFEQDEPGLTAQLGWCLIRTGVSSFAARGTWINSKLPALVMPTVKRRYHDERATFLTTLTDGLSLAAVGLRHRKYQAEVRKTLEKGAPPVAERMTAAAVVRNYAALYFEQHTIDPQPSLDHLIEISRTLVRQSYAGRPEEEIAAVEQLPSDFAVALMLSMPLSVHQDLHSPRGLFQWLPWIVSAEAKSFYLPDPLSNWLRAPWTPFDALVLLEARKEGGVPRPQPIVAAPKIGRNEPCPCGSGKKHKRCCGGPGQPAAA